jgi:hypothetical protein
MSWIPRIKSAGLGHEEVIPAGAKRLTREDYTADKQHKSIANAKDGT